MTDDLLSQVQKLQFTDKRAAETLLVPFIREIFALDVVDITIRPLAVSLNSFNGFIHLGDGEQLFFKTHIEADGVIDEYYNATQLDDAGYKVLKPVYESTQAGKQLLIYPVMQCPSVFDAAWQIEHGEGAQFDRLRTLQEASDQRLMEIYQTTLRMQSAEVSAKAPIHQLFFHRLTGGRLDRFYGTGTGVLWGDELMPMQTVRHATWTINGRRYTQTLEELIQQAIVLLEPKQSQPAIIGHGDAHNGNVFFCTDEDQLVFFDPAFAGVHHPLLDLTKPLFHNVFAMWMYFPEVMSQRLTFRFERSNAEWRVDYDDTLPPIREMFLRSKVENTLTPTLRMLNEQGWLREDWKLFLKAALMCCPLLTMNLTEANRFPPNIAILGLVLAIEMGGTSTGNSTSRIDQVLEACVQAL